MPEFAYIDTIFENGKSEVAIPIEHVTNGEKRNFSVCFLEPENQPTIFVDIGEELNDLLSNRDLKVDGDICIYDVNSELLIDETVKIKGHGNGSWWNSQKKSWLLDFDTPTAILGMDKGYKYIAVSNACDPSYLRNKFVYDWAEELGMNDSPHSEFGNLYINGEYLGLYLVTEGVEVSEDRISVRKDESQSSRLGYFNLQKYEYADEKGYLLPDDMIQYENTGYLLREENDDERYPTVECGFITKSNSRFEVIYPKKASKKQVSDIKNYIQLFQNAVESEDGCCETESGKRHYSEFIDLDSFVKKYLIEEISKNHDGNDRSSYYYIKDYETDNKLYAGPVWDYDRAFGNFYDHAPWLQPKGIIKLRPGLDQHEEFVNYVIQYYIAYCRPYLETRAETELKKEAESIRRSVWMDQTRWMKEKVSINPNSNFDEEVGKLISFIQIRKLFLDDVWLKGKVFYRVNFVDNDDIVKTEYLEAGKKMKEIEFVHNTYSTYAGKIFIGWYDEGLENEIDYEEEITDDMAFWAKWE